MPTYDYECPKCGHAFELVQSMRDEPIKRCPKCKKLGVKRLVGGGAGLIFKGTGFYITDYKNKDSAAKEKRKASTSTASTSTASESKSSETKPAASPAAPAAKPAAGAAPTAKK
jgi:putative FmdB family regulatory protein